MATVVDAAREDVAKQAHNVVYQKGNDNSQTPNPTWVDTVQYNAGTAETHIPHADDATGVNNTADSWLPAVTTQFLDKVAKTERFEAASP